MLDVVDRETTSGEDWNPDRLEILVADGCDVDERFVVRLGMESFDVDAGDVGLDAAWSAVEGTEERPPRTQGEIVTDEDGSGAKALVEFLASKKFI